MNNDLLTRRQVAKMCAAMAAIGPAEGDPEDSAIRDAMRSDRAAIPKAESDPSRPVYHFHPPANWNNDPNGTVWYKGWHHLFYQHNPYGATWGHMHWGHARSRDLVNWEHLPIALWPSKEKGEEHVYSGGAIAGPDGRPWLFYTSIGDRPPEQWLAVPEDDELIKWKKHPANPILTLKIHGATQVNEWRDPFPFRKDGRSYVVCGGNLQPSGGRAAVQLYESVSADLTAWKYRGPVFEYRDRAVHNIECPNLFQLGAKFVLLVSPERPCEYFVGELDLWRGKFIPETHGILDAGRSYASNISFDNVGRCILWLWGRTDTNPDRGWNNVMTLPRILSIGDDGYLRQTPAPEFESLRREAKTIPAMALNNQSISLSDRISGDCLEFAAELTADSASSMGLRVRCASRGKSGLEIAYNPGNGVLSVGGIRTSVAIGKTIRLRGFLDKRAIEVYANDGEAAIFTVTDAAPSSVGVEAFAAGGNARLASLEWWALNPARFRMERFQ
ncbi:MAG: glycoside hydrolase family 32 protein [Ignavibacteriota bacterium]